MGWTFVPTQVSSSLCVMKEAMSAEFFFFFLSLSAPWRGDCNSIFCRNHMTRYPLWLGVSVWGEGRPTGLEQCSMRLIIRQRLQSMLPLYVELDLLMSIYGLNTYWYCHFFFFSQHVWSMLRFAKPVWRSMPSLKQSPRAWNINRPHKPCVVNIMLIMLKYISKPGRY